MLTHYSGIEALYFRKLLRTLIEVGNLEHRRVLDFGCGKQELRRMLSHRRYVGYDIDPALSDVASPVGVPFDIMVVNEVFYEMPEADIVRTLQSIKPRLLVVGIGRKGLLNKLGALVLRPDAHADYRTPPEKELEILQRYYRIVKKKGVWGLADVYLLELL